MRCDKIDTEMHWYAMRDLKRSNARVLAYMLLAEAGLEVFTPMATRLITVNGKRVKSQVPIMHDLLFVNGCRQNLDPVVQKVPTLQYRFKRGGKQGEPIIVPEEDMRRFISVVNYSNSPKFYSADELSTLMCGRRIRIVGGLLDGYEGQLQTIRGSKSKNIVIVLQSLLAVSVEITDEFIELL